MQSISYIVSPAVAALLYSVWKLNVINAIIGEMREGFFVLKDNKGLFLLLLIGTLYMFVYMPINALYPLISMEYFNGTPMHVSITEIAYASGMLAGGLI